MSSETLRNVLEDIEDLMVRADDSRSQPVTNGALILAVGKLAAVVKDQAATIAHLQAVCGTEARD